MQLERSVAGIRAKLFYIDAASTLGFSKVEVRPCGEGAYCGHVDVRGGDGYVFVDLEGEGTLRANDLVYAIYKSPGEGPDNRFVPVPKGPVNLEISPSAGGPYGERVFELRGTYLYVKEPLSFRFVVRASLLADLAEYTNDRYLIGALNRALDEIEVAGLSEEQLEAASTYSIVKPPFYIRWKEYYDIRLDPKSRSMDPNELSAMAERALEVLDRELEKVLEGPSPPIGTLYAVGHAHIDVAWLWTPEITRQKLARTLWNVLSLARSYEMKFALSNALFIEWLREEPGLYEKVKEAVAKGVVVPVGGMWVESDTNVVGGESLVRQFLYGQRKLLEEFGATTEVGWLPDSFGYAASLPQILSKSGIKIFFTHKLYWNKANRFPYSVFVWEGVDGSRVIAVNYATYGSDLSPRQVVRAWKDHTSSDVPAFIAFGQGDGGGGPTWMMMERLRAYSRAPGIPRLLLADPRRYYEDVKGLSLPVWRGELYLETHRGTYSTGTKIKRLIRVAEEALKDLEVVSFMAGKCVDYKDLWLELLEACFHDVASATVIREVYDLYVERLERLVARVEGEIARISRELSRGDGVLVVNTLPWRRVDVAPAKVAGAIQQEIMGQVHSLVEAPPLGFASYAEGEGEAANPLPADGLSISNGRLLVRADGSIVDLEEDVEVVTRSAIVACEDIPAEWDGWDLEPWYRRLCREVERTGARLVERGPLRACLEVDYRHRDSEFTERICLWRHANRVDYSLRGNVLDRLKVFRKTFELGFWPTRAMAEIPYGVIERSLAPSNPWEEAKFEFPVWRWLDVYSSSYGFAVFNKGRPGHSVDGNVVGITLVKTPLFPNPHLDVGEVRADYAIYPHRGDWREAEVPRRALEYHRPLRVSRGSSNRSFLEIGEPNVLLETIKCGESREGFVARLWETYGGSAVVELGGVELDIPELRELARTRKLRFRPFEIKTVRLE
ncbi:MAG: glycoside hydrolase family 38 C-terminal domain-containing protein [Desulfurococcaceae archaeon]